MVAWRGVVAAVALLGAVAIAADPKPKTDIVLDTPENALRTYISAWKNTDYAGIMASLKITDEARKNVVVQYVTYMMWNDALERACVDKFGQEEGMKALDHVRTLVQQYDLDLKKRLLHANVEYDHANRNLARVFLRVEKDRPEGLTVDALTFRDDYSLIKDGANWKIDFLKTYKLDDPDADRQEEVKYNVTQAYPVVTKRLKELTEEVKSGKIKLADDVKTEIKNVWQRVPGAGNSP